MLPVSLDQGMLCLIIYELKRGERERSDGEEVVTGREVGGL